MDLTKFAEKAISINKSMSPGRRQTMARMLVSVADKELPTPEQRMFWISLIGAESKFDPAARSPVKAVGLGQILPAYLNDFSELCGYGDMKESDLQDGYTNLVLSSCIFRNLVQNTGSIPLALISYNAGPNSASMKAAKNGEAPTASESQAYLSRIWIRTINTKKEVLASD